MKTLGWNRFRSILMLLIGVALGTLVACKDESPIEFDTRYSVNIGKPKPGFPPKKMELTEAQKDILHKYGTPDYVRIWWNKDGSFVTSSDFSGKVNDVPKLLNQADLSWIYEENGQEVLFHKDGTKYKLTPISDELKYICKYGDPSQRQPPRMVHGVRYQTLQWIEHGFNIEFVNGVAGKQQYFPATGRGTYLGK